MGIEGRRYFAVVSENGNCGFILDYDDAHERRELVRVFGNQIIRDCETGEQAQAELDRWFGPSKWVH